MLLSKAIEQLAIATKADGRSPRTVQSYREKLGHLLRFLGDVEIESITTDQLRLWLAEMYDRGLSGFTVKSRVRHTKRLFNWLVYEGHLTENPTERIKTPNPKREEPKGITLDDFLALLQTTEGDSVIDKRDRAVMMFLLDTGCRVGGLAGLVAADLELEHLLAIVKEKGNKTRYVFFEKETAEALVEWLEVRPQCQTSALFVTLGRSPGKPLKTQGVARMLARRANTAGVTGYSNPHAFRHGFAKAYLMSGGDLGTLSDLMGHSGVQTTKESYGVYTIRELQQKHSQHSPIAQLRSRKDESIGAQ